MGLLTTLIIHKNGKKKGAKRERRRIELELSQANAICTNCGHPRYKHSDDAKALCPKY